MPQCHSSPSKLIQNSQGHSKNSCNLCKNYHNPLPHTPLFECGLVAVNKGEYIWLDAQTQPKKSPDMAVVIVPNHLLAGWQSWFWGFATSPGRRRSPKIRAKIKTSWWNGVRVNVANLSPDNLITIKRWYEDYHMKIWWISCADIIWWSYEWEWGCEWQVPHLLLFWRPGWGCSRGSCQWL